MFVLQWACVRIAPLLFAGLSALAVVRPAIARAEPGDSSDLPPIRWSVPLDCPSFAEWADELRHLLRDPGAARAAIAGVEVEVTHDAGDRYRLRLTVARGDGVSHQRDIAGDTCREVVDAAAVALALASDSEATRAAGRAEGVEPSDTAPIESVRPRERPDARATSTAVPFHADERTGGVPVADRATRGAAPTWDLEAMGGADFASMPRPTLGFGVGAAIEIARNRIDLRASGWLPQRAPLASLPSAGGDVGLVVGSLRYGRSLFTGMFDLVPGGGLEVGAMVAKGVGVDTSNLGAAPWVAPSASLMGVLHASRGFALSLELEGLVPLVRPRFEITSGGQVYQPPPATGRTALGVHGRFP